MEKQILKCSNLHKNFGKKEILKDISFEIEEGDILAFIGPNGSGKTTTIKLMLGLQTITSGKVTINGFDIETNFKEAIERVGAIVENPDLYMYLTGYQNLKLVANMYGIENARIDEVVKMVGLEKRINDKVKKYSLGMRQRLGIAQAIIHDPNLLILDEPTNGLDPEGIKELRDLLKMLAKKYGMAIFISSHNLAELESFCDKVCVIQNGVVIKSSSLKELKKGHKDTFYIIEVSNVKKALQLVKEAKEESENEIKISASKEEIAEINKNLINANINVYKIFEAEMSLEEAFLKMTGGNIID